MRPSRTVNRKCKVDDAPEFAFVVVDGGVALVIDLLGAPMSSMVYVYSPADPSSQVWTHSVPW
jgi:hypothetical protein